MTSVALSLIIYILIAGLLLAMPSLIFPSRPFGIGIVMAYANEPAVCAERRRYGRQLGTIAGGLLLADLIYLWSKPGSLLLPQASIIALVIAGWGNYYLSHCRLAQVNQEQQRLAGMRPEAELAAARRSKWPPRLFWVLLALDCAVVVLTIAIGTWRYPVLPTNLHYVFPIGLGAWTMPAAPFYTLLPINFQISATLLLAGLAWLLSFASKPAGLDDPDGSQYINIPIIQILMALLALAFNLAFLATGLAAWGLLQASGSPMDPVLLAPLALWLVAAPFLLIGLEFKSGSPRQSSDFTERDEDSYWKLGLVYINRSDPRLLIPKRIGIGKTLNLGNPLAWLILAALVVFIMARILLRG